MKKLIVILLLVPTLGFGQILPLGDTIHSDYFSFDTLNLFIDTTNIYLWTDSTFVSEIDSVCAVRGHVNGGSCMSTLMYCPPYIEETDSTSYLVYPACNTMSYTCLRCKQHIVEREKGSKILLWKKQP